MTAEHDRRYQMAHEQPKQVAKRSVGCSFSSGQAAMDRRRSQRAASRPARAGSGLSSQVPGPPRSPYSRAERARITCCPMATPTKDIEPEIDLKEEDEEQSLPESDEEGFDLGHEGSGPLAAGRAAILRFAKLAPSAPGVYRMIDRAGEVLYVGKAKNIRKRVVAYARPTGHDTRIERMIAATASARVRVDGDRDRGAAARGEPHQAPASALQRAAARRQVVPLYPHHRRPPRPADHEASRRAHAQRRLLRAVRLGAGGAPHDQRARARVPDPLVLGRGLREPHPAVPAAPDQALLGALHRRDRACRLRRACARGARLPRRAQRRGARRARRRDGEGRRGARFRARRGLSRPARRAVRDPGAPGHQPAQRCRSGRLRRASAGRLHLHRGVLLPHRPELGQPRLFPQGRPLAGGRRGAGIVPGAILRRQAVPALRPHLRRRFPTASCSPPR